MNSGGKVLSASVFKAPAGVAGFDDIAVMGQPIEHGRAILASPNVWGQSAKARLVVISSDVFS
jgi:hypothetical protein